MFIKIRFSCFTCRWKVYRVSPKSPLLQDFHWSLEHNNDDMYGSVSIRWFSITAHSHNLCGLNYVYLQSDVVSCIYVYMQQFMFFSQMSFASFHVMLSYSNIKSYPTFWSLSFIGQDPLRTWYVTNLWPARVLHVALEHVWASKLLHCSSLKWQPEKARVKRQFIVEDFL